MKLLEKTIEAFETKVTVRELSIGQTMELNKLEPEEIMLKALAMSIVEPKMTVKELNDLPVRFMKDVITLSGAFNE